MSTATNVEATAVNTIEWLAAGRTTIVVPVYQRQYRWDIGGCERLLSDVRAVAAEDDAHRHFLGSILSAQDGSGEDADLILIDGQQRITTLMLLVAALHHAVRDTDPDLAAELSRVLVLADAPGRTKLRPHDAWAELYESVLLDRRDDLDRESRFDDNYAFFRSQIHVDEVPLIWRGLQRLEHVSITLGPRANAQQIFESLNSTGEPLRDHELIHNYILMGLSHAEQLDVESRFWLPIEQHTGEAIGAFWRHYLVMVTGREVAANGEHGVYSAFRQSFPRVDVAHLQADAANWRHFAELYGILLDPSREPDLEIARQLRAVNTFGRSSYPLVLNAYSDHVRGRIDRAEFLQTLEWLQAMYLRRVLVNLPTERLIARLCRARANGQEALARAIARITPSDERVSAVLKYSELPYPAYVLGRLEGVDEVEGFDVEHIVPAVPGDAWSGDGVRPWSEYSEDEQNSHRALAPTLGNLTLLEQGLTERVFGASFPVKRDEAYARSTVPATRELTAAAAWGTAAITARTVALTTELLRIWARPALPEIDDDGLTPILDAVRRRGWPAGWEREFDYVEYRGERWEVYDVKHLFNRVFRRAWTDTREAAVAYCAAHGGPIYDAQAWKGQWDRLDDEHSLYMGWDSNYMMTAVQGVLEESGLASEVFVKYSYIGNVM
ncbi:GmrSD restriction endonuclease domain-containing protein [Microbacterium sufflavum]